MRSVRAKFLWSCLLGLLPVLAGLGLMVPLRGWEDASWYRLLKRQARPAPTTDAIRLILIDEQSLNWAESEMALSWPWPREVHAAMVQHIAAGQPKAIFLDLLFNEPSVYGVADDEVLGAAVADAGNVVGSLYLATNGPLAVADWPGDWPRPVAAPGPSPDEEANLPAWPRTSPPIDEVATNVAQLASVRLAGHGGALIDRGPLAVPGPSPQEWIPSPALACYRIDRNGLPERLRPSSPPVRLLRFRGDESVYQPLSAAAVIRSFAQVQEGLPPDVPSDVFRDRFVMVGASAAGLMDVRPNPISRESPGVFLHATQLDNLLHGDFPRPAPPALWLPAGYLLGVLLLFGMLCSRRVRTGLLLLAVALAVPFALSHFWLATADWRWPLLPFGVTTIVAWTLGLGLNYITEGRQRAFIRSAFRQYLSDEVIEDIVNHPDRLQLGGERRELTILFSDLQGFSSISEDLPPDRLTALINEYLTAMTDIIHAHRGTIDKYEGDAVIAFWNAPAPEPRHATLACQAAVACSRRLAEMRADLRVRYGHPLHMRIGLNTGEVVVGNMGSNQRFNYTILGDAANLAARLEGANKRFGTEIMVSEHTLRACEPGAVASREIGPLRVVGKREAVVVHELRTDPSPNSERHAEALAAWKAGQRQRALDIWSRIPDDPLAAAYRDAATADPDWDGVFELNSK